MLGLMSNYKIRILGLAYNGIINAIGSSAILNAISISLLSFSDMFYLVLAVYLGLGIGIGILGSTISMRKYLKV